MSNLQLAIVIYMAITNSFHNFATEIAIAI